MLRFLLLATLVGSSLQAATDNKPNVIFILADDIGWQDVGFHGTNLVPTPNIDALAYSGVILNNYYVTPLCSPSRAALMSARHPTRTGMWETVVNATEPYGLALDEKIFPQYFKEHGYATHMVGKWHLGFFRSKYLPKMRGFNSYFGHLNSRCDYWNYKHQSETEGWIGYDLYDGLTPAKLEPGEYVTRLYGRKVTDIINKHNTHTPLFLYYAPAAAHMGNFYQYLQVPQETVDKVSPLLSSDRRHQAAVINELDTTIGAMMQALSNRNMLKNTIVVFSTDNGGPSAYFPTRPASNWPLRSGKITTWEGGVKGTAFVWSPLLNNVPRVSKQMMHIQDWIPTLLGSFGKKPTGNKYELDGVNAWNAINNPDEEARNEVLHMINPLANYAALRVGKWKLTVGSPTYGLFDFSYNGQNENILGEYNIASVLESPAALAVEKTTGKSLSKDDALRLRREATFGPCPVAPNGLCHPLSMKPCLFDVETDYCEKADLSDQNPDVVASLLEVLARYNVTVVPSRKVDPDPNSNPDLYGGNWVPWYDILYPITGDEDQQ